MEYKYKPFMISIDFDEKVEVIDSKRWVIGATVDIGDANGPRFKDKRSRIEKGIDRILFGRNHQGHPDSLGYSFTFFVCSPEFKDHPTDQYKKYTSIMLVQDTYNRYDAEQWLKKKIQSIDDVTEAELTSQLHLFLESEEWDFDQK